MNNRYMMNKDDVMNELGVAPSTAYKIIRNLNIQLSNAGFVTVAGKIPRAFWEKNFYGAVSERDIEKGEENACL